MWQRRSSRWLVLAAAATLVLAACGGSDDGAEVRPFSEIQASEFAFENDPTFPGRGIFRVETTEATICSITWGPTEAMGNQNNSLDMNGTGIIDHNVFLPGAEAGQTYFFQVQGSTADGQLFQSEQATFTLPAAEGPTGAGADDRPAVGANLAPAATVTEVSSEFSSAWAGANAIDDDLATEWSTAGDGNDGFITIDLGSPQEVAGVEFLTRSMADGSATTSMFTLIVDGDQSFGPFPAGDVASPTFAAAEFTGQVLRFEIEDSTGGNTGAVEIRVFAPPG